VVTVGIFKWDSHGWLSETVNSWINVTVSSTGEDLVKCNMKKQLMLVPVPPEFLKRVPRMTRSKALDDFWKSMPNEVKVARESIVQKFRAFTPPQLF